MKLAAVLACRNQSARLYAKPLQNLDVKNNVTILDYMIGQIKLNKTIDKIVLAISEQPENLIYKEIAGRHGLPYVTGSDRDVLLRLIKGGELAGADHILRVTTESPYTYYDTLPEVYEYHCKNGCDYSVISGVPDGAYYELIKLDAFKKSWDLGADKHRSELCTLYIFEHQDQFKIMKHNCKKKFERQDIRLTVDWPEDLIVMRAIYEGVNLSSSVLLDFNSVIEFLDKYPKINAINNWIDSGIGRIWY
jgi:spore coat polysaccharide biosynthesis protein SpsF